MELIDQWKIQDSLDVYEVNHWGKGYFSINDQGHVTSTKVMRRPSVRCRTSM